MIGTTPRPPQHFPAAVLLLLALLATGCSGGGGGGASNARPVVIAASFVGGSATPAAGDTLLLTFSEPIALVSGKTLGDADVALTGGASLGSVTAAPTITGTNAIAIQLGTGVNFTPGTTTITLLDPTGSTGNDTVLDATGQLGGSGTPVTIRTSDGAAPSISNLTIAAIDVALNGTGAAGGTLQVPANGWTIDLTYSDNGTITTGETWITANVAVATASGSQPPGTNLVPFLTLVAADNTEASYRVPATTTFPNGAFVLNALVVDGAGRGSLPATFDATTRAFTAALRPFETTSNTSQVWFLDFTRDIESFTTSPSGSGLTVNVVATANGTSDFEDILRVLGLNTSAPIANVQGSLDSNQVVNARWKQALLDELAGFYAGANVTFTLTQPSGSFGSNSSVSYNSLGFSRIAIAGSSDTEGVLGIAIFDPNNETQNDDTLVDFGGTRLGIFLHTIIDAGLGAPSLSLFRQTYDVFTPGLGGTAIGADAADDDRLNGTNTDGRAQAIDAAIADLARFTAVVVAHECGHSMGLVQNGAMPTGLYGNDATNFPGSSDGHIRNTALFPAGTNIMSPALSYNAAINAATAFNSLNLAYLREQVFYGN